MDSHPHTKRVLVLGGGITGLAAAHRLIELSQQRNLPVHVTLLEASDRLGGVIRTEYADGFLIERGPDNFITNKPAATNLCERVGLGDELIKTNDAHRRALVVRKGRLVPIPEGFELMAPRNLWAMALSPIFSPLGKLRMLMERFIAAKPNNEDESLESFVVRRFGREALDRLVQPLIGGIYVADPKLLSLRATVPRFLEMEAKHGSIIKAMRVSKRTQADAGVAKDTGARYSLFMALRRGMQSLVDALAQKLGTHVQMGAKVEAVEEGDRKQETGDRRWESAVQVGGRIEASTGSVFAGSDPHAHPLPHPLPKRERESEHGARWTVRLADGRVLPADAVVVTTPSHIAAQWLQPLDAPLASALSAISYASSAIVVLGYKREQVTHPLDAFGFVVPAIEKRRIVAGSFSHQKYEGRVPQGHVLLRAFIGGALQPELAELPEDQLVALAKEELASLLGVTGEPVLVRVQRWMQSMPQYHVGHLQHVANIRAMAAKHAGLELAGNAYEGVGIPDCIANAEQAAERLIARVPDL